MTRDLTDHLRERDESEGPPMTHDIITNAEAKDVLSEMNNIEEEYKKYQWVLPPSPPLAFRWIRRLLADREGALETIASGASRCWVETDRATAYCFFCGVEFALKDGRPPEHIWMGIGLQHNNNCFYVKARRLLAAVEE